jgi:ribosomal protein L35AE/L33A
MHVLRIEYPVPDYGAWKVAFDRDRLDRKGSGVRRYRVLRATDDPSHVLIDLDFDGAGEAQAYLDALQRAVYASQEASPVSGGGPQTRIVEVVESKEY